MSEDAFREEVRSWIEDNCPKSLRMTEPNRPEVTPADSKAWLDACAAKGYTTPTWPKEYGSAGLSKREAKILQDEAQRAGTHIAGVSFFGTVMLGPVLLEFGNEEQKQEHLPRITSGEIQWCQGYSEPGAGSDLAGLQTRAVLDGDKYIVNGSKIWTTMADKADWIFCLVRTDPDAPKHDGISFLLFPLKQEGVTVSPLKLISGESDFCQVFFEDAKAEAKNLVGPLNGGWTIAKRLLQHERSTDGGSEGGITGAMKETFVDVVKREVGMQDGQLSDPALRQRLADQEIEARGLRLTMRRAREEARAGQVTRDIGSLGKYRWANMVKSEQDIVMSAMGTQGLGWSGPGFEDTQLERTRAWLTTRSDSIWGGTNEVQLNVVAKRVLKIPE